MCDYDSFKSLIDTFDPTMILFKRWGKLKQSKVKYERYMLANRDRIRGFHLISLQFKLKLINEKLETMRKNIMLILNNLKNQATKVIQDEAMNRWIDPALWGLLLNKKEIQNISSKQDGVVLNSYVSTQQFNIRHDSHLRFNKFINVYEGTLLAENHADISVYMYPSETIKRTSKDGKFFEDHIMHTARLHTYMQELYPEYFCKLYGIYCRKVGVDPRDKDMYLFYEILDEDWVCLKDFITSTGGLVRIPFLVTSNSIFHVIKYWFQKILIIVDLCQQNGC